MPLRNFRAVEWKWWKPHAGSHCKTLAPRLPAQTPSFRSTSWNWGCFLIKALVDWVRFSEGCDGNFKLHLTGIFKFTKFDQMEHVYCISLWMRQRAGWKKYIKQAKKKEKKVMGGKESVWNGGCWLQTLEEGCEGSPQSNRENQKSAAFWVNLRCFSIPGFRSTPAVLSGTA